jgi:hypothetical protein
MVTRSDGADLPSAPKTERGIKSGAARTVPAAERKWRRLIFEGCEEVLMTPKMVNQTMPFENKVTFIAAGNAAPLRQEFPLKKWLVSRLGTRRMRRTRS